MMLLFASYLRDYEARKKRTPEEKAGWRVRDVGMGITVATQNEHEKISVKFETKNKKILILSIYVVEDCGGAATQEEWWR